LAKLEEEPKLEIKKADSAVEAKGWQGILVEGPNE